MTCPSWPSTPTRSGSTAFFCPFHVRQARQAVQRAAENRAKIREVTLAEVNLNDGQRMLAFNDFFVGCQSHVSARYVLRVDNQAEPQSSSGLIVSTGAGSTGWLSSVFNMAEGFAQLGRRRGCSTAFSWPGRTAVWFGSCASRSAASNRGPIWWQGGSIKADELVIESLMPSGGVIFSDGVESDFLEFSSGTIARIGVANSGPGSLWGNSTQIMSQVLENSPSLT